MRQLLETEIFIRGSDQLTLADCEYLLKKEAVAALALEMFLKCKISFGDYCDILETCEMNIDDYLITVEENLTTCGLV